MADEFTHFLVMTLKPGYWGRGATIAEALKSSTYIEVGDEVRVFRATPDARVDGMGRVFGVEAATRQIGKVASGRRVVNLTNEATQA